MAKGSALLQYWDPCSVAHLAGSLRSLASRGLARSAEAQCTVAVSACQRLAGRWPLCYTRSLLCSSRNTMDGRPCWQLYQELQW